MGEKSPKQMKTKAMANAIEMALPKTCHRLCKWHIYKNVAQHLASEFTNLEFKKIFNIVFHGCCSQVEFQSIFDEMIKKFNL